MIIYFSGTGNCFQIAKALGQVLDEVVVPLKKATNNQDQNLTFIFPTYCYDIPKNVREFIQNFEIASHQTVMGISVSAGESGNSEATFNRLIEAKGFTVSRFKKVVMTDNSMPVLLHSKVEVIEVDVKQVIQEFLSQPYENQARYNPLTRVAGMALYNPLSQHLARKRVDVNQCVGCEICSSICPNDNIQVVDQKAVIGKNCTECFGCLHWCPRQAIRIRKGFNQTYQCPNPAVKVSELNQ